MREHRFTVKKPGSWERRQDGRFANLVFPPDLESRVSKLEEEIDCVEVEIVKVQEDIGKLEHDIINRPRPYPYDGSQLTLQGAGANAFGLYTQLIPVGTYDFADSPNRIQITTLVVEDLSGNDRYIVELYKTSDAVTFTPIGAIRFVRLNPFTRSWVIEQPCRPLNNDDMALYGRLKTFGGGDQTLTFSLSVARYLPTTIEYPLSIGPWPWG